MQTPTCGLGGLLPLRLHADEPRLGVREPQQVPVAPSAPLPVLGHLQHKITVLSGLCESVHTLRLGGSLSKARSWRVAATLHTNTMLYPTV